MSFHQAARLLLFNVFSLDESKQVADASFPTTSSETLSSFRCGWLAVLADT